MTQTDCPFCNSKEIEDRTIDTDNYFSAIYSRNSLSEDHVMIISNEHRVDVSDLSPEESKHLIDFVKRMLNHLKDKGVYDGYNIFTNIGKSAGQSVDHFHLHILPRSTDEKESPSEKINRS